VQAQPGIDLRLVGCGRLAQSIHEPVDRVHWGGDSCLLMRCGVAPCRSWRAAGRQRLVSWPGSR
jgi:hypothetical protein